MFQTDGNGFAFDLQIIYGIQNHELGVQKRILRKNRIADIAAIRRHSLNKIFTALFQVNHIGEIPGVDLIM